MYSTAVQGETTFGGLAAAAAIGAGDAWLSARDFRDNQRHYSAASPDAFSRVALIGAGLIGVHQDWQPELSRAMLITGLAMGVRDTVVFQGHGRGVAKYV